ncbi:unnamed protein product [Ilex paraguariensis]|uniref:Secreted protein n=1 Tax=Ilex paraguariensis TaxID=185542 RepID=A0ABC8R6H3_9AQUA
MSERLSLLVFLKVLVFGEGWNSFDRSLRWSFGKIGQKLLQVVFQQGTEGLSTLLQEETLHLGAQLHLFKR